MGREIERKFLVRPERWPRDPAAGIRYRQGYLSVDPGRVVRVRIEGDRAFLTIKGETRGIERDEFEYPIPIVDAEAMLDRLCLRPLVEKTRHRVEHGGSLWEVDVFAGANEGLVVAEIELPTADAEFARPAWLGAEVSHDARYFNSNLARHPWREWAR